MSKLIYISFNKSAFFSCDSLQVTGQEKGEVHSANTLLHATGLEVQEKKNALCFFEGSSLLYHELRTVFS